MDTILLVLAFVFMIIGVLGSFLPVLPGLPFSWLGIALLYYTTAVPANYTALILLLLITILVSILDYFIPAQGTKRFGGSKYGVWGTNIGLIIGILSPIPLGFIIGPFVGAFVGEMINNSQDKNKALKAATGSFIGFLASTFMKFIVAIAFLGYFLAIVWKYRAQFF